MLMSELNIRKLHRDFIHSHCYVVDTYVVDMLYNVVIGCVCVQCLQCKLSVDLHRAMQGQVAANSPLSTCTRRISLAAVVTPMSTPSPLSLPSHNIIMHNGCEQ